MSRRFHSKGRQPQRSNETPDRRRIVIGLHAAREVLRVRPNKISEIWLKEGAERNRDLAPFLDFARGKKLKLLMKNDGALDKIAPSHQGVCLYVDETPELDLEALAAKPETEKIILLALDEVSDPHNVGAVLRTAWLLGASGVLVTENRSAHLTPSAIKVASGAAEHVPLLVVGNLANELTYLKDKGFWVYGLAGESKSQLWQTQFSEKVVLIIGAEDKGIRSTSANVCDELITIPQIEPQASFNASVAAAIALYEVARQHKMP